MKKEEGKKRFNNKHNYICSVTKFYLSTVKKSKARASPGRTTSCCMYTFHALTQGNLEIQPTIFLQQFSDCSKPIPSECSKFFCSGEIEGLKSKYVGVDLDALLRLLSVRAGIPLYTDVRSQYSKHTDITFQSARVMADAVRETKLIIKPVMTGANSLQIKSIRLMTEFIFVSCPGGWPSDITTTLPIKYNCKCLQIS